MLTFPPTDEQRLAIEAFETGDNVVLEALAGTGKSSTLQFMAEQADRLGAQGNYIAYNTSIAHEAKKKFPRSCFSSTAHSLAFKPQGLAHIDQVNAKRPWSSELADIIYMKTFKIDSTNVVIRKGALATMARETVQRFCYSADPEITIKHVPKPQRGAITPTEATDLANFILPYAKVIWHDAQRTVDWKIGWSKAHDYYLKMYALTNPQPFKDYILYDEAQDANPCMEGIVKNSGVQLVMVGDANQQIYAWRGAEDALSRFDAPHRLPLSQSFRFGEKIADEANKWLTLLNAPVPIKGFEKIDSKVKKIDDPDAILCRTNAQTIAEAMALSELGLSFSIVGGTAEIKAFARGADDLQNNRPTEHPELFMFKNWEHFKEHVEAEGGSDLDVFIRLVENYGTTTIIEVADSSLKREALADVVISTAHKAKGREWPRVQIAPDFKEPGPDPETGQERMPSKAEMQLAYVACTRAGKVLDNTAMDWINRWLPEKKEEDNGRIIASALREARGQ